MKRGSGAWAEKAGAIGYVRRLRAKRETIQMTKHLTREKTNIANTKIILSAVNVSSLAKMVVSNGLIEKNQRILSLGAGIGLDEQYFVTHVDVDVLGTEIDETILKQAKTRENSRLTFLPLDVTVPFHFDAPFDCVYTRNLLHYFPTPEQQFILEQISTVLGSEGLLVLQLKSKDDMFYKSQHVKKVMQHDGMAYFPQFGYSRNHLSEQETRHALHLAGFEIHSIVSSSEVLYSDTHESTLITAIARKRRTFTGHRHVWA